MNKNCYSGILLIFVFWNAPIARLSAETDAEKLGLQTKFVVEAPSYSLHEIEWEISEEARILLTLRKEDKAEETVSVSAQYRKELPKGKGAVTVEWRLIYMDDVIIAAERKLWKGLKVQLRAFEIRDVADILLKVESWKGNLNPQNAENPEARREFDSLVTQIQKFVGVRKRKDSSGESGLSGGSAP